MIKLIKEIWGLPLILTILSFVLYSFYINVTGDRITYVGKSIVKENDLVDMYKNKENKTIDISEGQIVGLFVKNEESFQYKEFLMSSVKIQWGEVAQLKQEANRFTILRKTRKGDDSLYYYDKDVTNILVLPKDEAFKYVVFK